MYWGMAAEEAEAAKRGRAEKDQAAANAAAAREQQQYERQRQAFQEQIIAAEQSRRHAETANQYYLGVDNNNTKKRMMQDAMQGFNSMNMGMGYGFQPLVQNTPNVNLYDHDGARLGGSFGGARPQGQFSTFRKSLLG